MRESQRFIDRAPRSSRGVSGGWFDGEGLLQQVIAVEVVDFHGVTHVAEGGGGGFPRFLAAGFQNFQNVRQAGFRLLEVMIYSTRVESSVTVANTDRAESKRNSGWQLLKRSDFRFSENCFTLTGIFLLDSYAFLCFKLCEKY